MKLSNLEKEVCSLEYSQKLKELGVCQDSPFTWVNAAWTYEINSSLEKRIAEAKVKLCFGDIRMIKDIFASWPAPTCGQLFEWLPQRVTVKEGEPFNSFRLCVEKALLMKEVDDMILPHYLANYRCDSTECHGENAWLVRTLLPHTVNDKNLANCLAQLVIYLFENNLIEDTTIFVPENAADLILGKKDD